MIKEVFQRRAKQVNDQDVVQAFLAEVVDIGNASCEVLLVYASLRISARAGLTAADEDLVCPVLVAKLRSVALPGFLHSNMSATFMNGLCEAGTYKLDSDLLAVQKVHTLKDDAKRALSDLLPYSVVHPHNVRR